MIDIEAPIKEVTVYSDRALVIRRKKFELEAGEHDLRINNLPQFLRDSLRAAGRGSRDALSAAQGGARRVAGPSHGSTRG